MDTHEENHGPGGVLTEMLVSGGEYGLEELPLLQIWCTTMATSQRN